MNKIFNLDGPLFALFQKIADLFLLNLAFIICCIPIITIGPATCALYSMTMEMIRKEHNSLFLGFFSRFKKYFLRSLIIEIIFAGIIAFLAFDYVVFRNMNNPLQYVVLISGVYILFALLYVFCIIPVFDNGIKNALRNAFVLPFIHLPWTLLILAVNVLIIYASFHDLTAFYKYWVIIWISIGFSGIAYVCSFLFHRAFMVYFPEWEQERLDDLEELHKETTK